MSTLNVVIFNVICGLLSYMSTSMSLGLAIIATVQSLLVLFIIPKSDFIPRARVALFLWVPLVFIMVAFIAVKGLRGSEAGFADSVGLYFSYIWWGVPGTMLFFHFRDRITSKFTKQ